MANQDDLGSGNRPTSLISQDPNRAPSEPAGSTPRANAGPSTGTESGMSERSASGPQAQSGDLGTIAEQAKEQVKTLTLEAKDETAKLAGQAKEQVTTLLSERKDQAAQRLASLAGALREAAHKLNTEAHGGGRLGRYANHAAEQVDRISSYVRETDIGKFLRDTGHFARRRPDVFLGATFLTGLLAARFLKASGSSKRESQMMSAGGR